MVNGAANGGGSLKSRRSNINLPPLPVLDRGGLAILDA
jgi:hypothetical protein